jgi:hypothetical protein
VSTYDLIDRVQRELASLSLIPVRRGRAIGINDTDLLPSPRL